MLDIGQVLFCVLNELRDGAEVHKLAKEQGQYPVLTEQTWSVKDLLYGYWGNVSCRTRQVVPGKHESCILTDWVANHSAEFHSSCPLAELGMY